MKRLLTLLLLLVLAICSCRHNGEEMPFYQQYAPRTDLTVAQVNGFRLNDTVKVDVVILVADDSASWQGLKEEFDIRTNEGVTSWMGDIDHPQQRKVGGGYPCWRAIAVHAEQTIAFYRIERKTQYNALLDYQFDKIKNTSI